jgi:hypothetical protein
MNLHSVLSNSQDTNKIQTPSKYNTTLIFLTEGFETTYSVTICAI